MLCMYSYLTCIPREYIPIRWWMAIRVSWRRLSLTIVQKLVYRCDDARCASHDFVYPSLTILRRPEVRHSSLGYEIWYSRHILFVRCHWSVCACVCLPCFYIFYLYIGVWAINMYGNTHRYVFPFRFTICSSILIYLLSIIHYIVSLWTIFYAVLSLLDPHLIVHVRACHHIAFWVIWNRFIDFFSFVGLWWCTVIRRHHHTRISLRFYKGEMVVILYAIHNNFTCHCSYEKRCWLYFNFFSTMCFIYYIRMWKRSWLDGLIRLKSFIK